MNKILLEDNLQQNFVLIKNAIMEMRFCIKILHCHAESLRKKFKGSISGKARLREFLGKCYFFIFKTCRNEGK